MHYVPFVTVLSLLMFFWMTFNVGRGRARFGIQAPATTGHQDFERVFRVHQNTLEQMMLFLPSLWIFGAHISDLWAALLGLVWIAGRVIYALGYYKEASARGKGFVLSLGATGILLLGSLVKTGMMLAG
jgi:glutathione S-transferase